jgi:hypothetical protein
MPDPLDQSRWLRFNAFSLQLAMLLDQTKAGAFKTQLIRQITQANPVGTLLCVRSLIEHRALATWLPQILEISINALAGEVRAKMPLPSQAADVAQPLTNFLAVNARGSKEEQRPWVTHEVGGVRTAWLNLGKIVKDAFPGDDRFRILYAVSSAAMHGRKLRSCEIALDADALTLHSQFLALLALVRLSDNAEEMDHLAPTIRQFVRLDHAAAFGGTSAANSDVMAQQAFGRIDQALVVGIDYSGDGTPESPFRVGSHLQFHQASRAVLQQLGVDIASCSRALDHAADGRLCDRWRGPSRDYWFEVNGLGGLAAPSP